ncbi:MAP kinase kinase kinase10 [Zea mays]|uniref:MAP kinase kinase kinase10 n=1 Tax=Zea mays TaxID=4577 RepID=A0A1D6PEA3_MAIZE|nr:MAP kinase kinase kinase10 [Zea mays]
MLQILPFLFNLSATTFSDTKLFYQFPFRLPNSMNLNHAKELFIGWHRSDLSRVVNPQQTYGPAADIWSLGCTVLEMLTRQIPYPDLEWAQALYRIGKGESPAIPNTLSRDARDFISRGRMILVRANHAELAEREFVLTGASIVNAQQHCRQPLIGVSLVDSLAYAREEDVLVEPPANVCSSAWIENSGCAFERMGCRVRTGCVNSLS